MKRIFVFSPTHTDACALYRGIGVFTPLRHSGYLIERAPDHIDWSTISGGDLFYMQRPFNEHHVKRAKIAQRQMPLWVDYDDALFHVPVDNPAWETYYKPSVKDSIAELLEMADIVTFATPKLAELFGEQANFRHEIIPNAYNNYLFPTELPTSPREKRVLWRGSNSHQGDLTAFAPQIAELTRKYSDWDFLFLGNMPWMLPQETRFSYHSGDDLFTYFPLIRDKLKAAIQIVPLIDNDFNRGKSNIAWQEATHAGSITLAPNWPEWQLPGVMLYDDQADFVSQLEILLSLSADQIRMAAEQSWDHIAEHLFLSNINRYRISIIEDLTS